MDSGSAVDVSPTPLPVLVEQWRLHVYKKADIAFILPIGERCSQARDGAGSVETIHLLITYNMPS